MSSRPLRISLLSLSMLVVGNMTSLSWGQQASPALSDTQQETTQQEDLQQTKPDDTGGQTPAAGTATLSEHEDSPQLQKYKQEVLYPRFTKLLTGAKLTGQFTVDGKPLNELTEESYEIKKVEKQAEGDGWIITSRIKYGKRDLTIPIPLDVKWAGDTPVMTLDNLTIPGFGTFAARVVFHKDKYAGTWQHDDVGGHLFGRIELLPE